MRKVQWKLLKLNWFLDEVQNMKVRNSLWVLEVRVQEEHSLGEEVGFTVASQPLEHTHMQVS